MLRKSSSLTGSVSIELSKELVDLADKAQNHVASVPQVTDEAAKKALKEMEEDWNELEGQLLGQSPSEAPAQPPGQVKALLPQHKLCSLQDCAPCRTYQHCSIWGAFAPAECPFLDTVIVESYQSIVVAVIGQMTSVSSVTWQAARVWIAVDLTGHDMRHLQSNGVILEGSIWVSVLCRSQGL